MARESTLGQRGVLAVDSDLPLFAAFPEDKVFRLERGAVRVRIGFQPRTATPAPERQQPLPGGHSLTVVGEGANILELKHDHIPGIGLIVRQGGPCHVRLDCGDGAVWAFKASASSPITAPPTWEAPPSKPRGQSGPQGRVAASGGPVRAGTACLLGRWRAQGLDRGLPRSPGWHGW